MENRNLQIDVLGEMEQDKNLIVCRLTVDGRDCRFVMFRHDYEGLISDKVFVRDGKTQDSAGVWNTTNTFIEKVYK